MAWFRSKSSPALPTTGDSYIPPPQHCRDCEAVEGSLHDLFCLQERCPFCFDQLAVCRCIHSVLSLTPVERQLVDEYVDDSIEPLKGIVDRWTAALEKQGRLRYVFTPNLCRRCGALDPAFFRVSDAEWGAVIPAHLAREVFCRSCYDFLKQRIEARG